MGEGSRKGDEVREPDSERGRAGGPSGTVVAVEGQREAPLPLPPALGPLKSTCFPGQVVYVFTGPRTCFPETLRLVSAGPPAAAPAQVLARSARSRGLWAEALTGVVGVGVSFPCRRCRWRGRERWARVEGQRGRRSATGTGQQRVTPCRWRWFTK